MQAISTGHVKNSFPAFEGLRHSIQLESNELKNLHLWKRASNSQINTFSLHLFQKSIWNYKISANLSHSSSNLRSTSKRSFVSNVNEFQLSKTFTRFSSASSSQFLEPSEIFPSLNNEPFNPELKNLFPPSLPANSPASSLKALSTSEITGIETKDENHKTVTEDLLQLLNASTLHNLDSSTPPSPSLPKLPPEALQYEPGFLGGISELTRLNDGQVNGAGFNQSTKSTVADFEYLRSILTSRVYDVAIESPLELANKLSLQLKTKIFLKREDMQQVFSFKLRGAYNMISNLSPEQRARGVICSSAGNHAQGVALSASKLNCKATIAMPITTPEIKWRSVENLGARVVLVGEAYDDAQAYAKKRAEEEGLVFIPPFDDPEVIAGQGTVGMEILRQHPQPLHAIFVPIGGGGLAAGIAAYVKAVRPEVRVIGVEPSDANAMALSMYLGRRVQLEHCGGFADGVAVKVVGEETFRICRQMLDGIVLVDRDSICSAIKDMFEETRSILEPAGALSLAGAKAYCSYYGLKDENVVVVTSGANMNFDRLRLVADLAGVGARKEFILATTLPETPGAFKSFCHMIEKSINITEFKYRYTDGKSAHVLYSLNSNDKDKVDDVIKNMNENEFPTIDLSQNGLAKDHLRHLVGGRSQVSNEILYRFVFPERPGALLKFLDILSPRWNITLFHYRTQGEDRANVLVGLQVLEEDEDEFHSSVEKLGYEYEDERNNPAFQMFMS